MAKEVLFFDVKMQGSSQMIKELTAVEGQLKNISKAKNKDAKETQKLKELELGLRAEKKRLSTELRKQVNAFNANKNAVKANINSYDGLVTKNKALSAQIRKLDQPLGKNKKKFDQLSRAMNDNTNKLKKMDAAMGRNFRNVGNYGGAIKKVGATFLKFAAGIGVAVMAVNKLFSSMKASIDKFDEQVKAEVSLKVALGKTSKALLNQATALQQITRFGDEATIGGQAFLAQMGLEEDAILKLTPAILDMAQAKGMDLRSAFDLVAKSVGSSTNALSRYGIEIEGAAGSTKRIDSAVAALNDKFLGQAEAATAGAGKLIQLDNAWGDLQESMGEVFVNTIAPLLKGLHQMVTALDILIDPTQKHSGALREEQIQMNILVQRLTSVNIKEEERKKLIDELNQKYPKFLENLDREKVTNEDLFKRLKLVNGALINKILIQEENEKIQEKAEAQLVRLREQIRLEEKVLRSVAEAQIKYKIAVDESLSPLDKSRILRNKIAEISNKEEKISRGLSIIKQNLTKDSRALNKAEENLGRAIQDTNDAYGDKEKLLSRLKITEEDIIVTTEKTIEVTKELTKEEKKLFKQREKAEEKQRLKAEKERLKEAERMAGIASASHEAYIQGIVDKYDAEQAIIKERADAINKQREDLEKQSQKALFSIVNNGVINRTERELSGLNEQRKQGILSEEQFEAQSLAVKKAAYRKQKVINLAEIAMNLALEMSAIARNAALNPLNAVTGGIAGLTQVATLQALAVVRASLNSAMVLSQKFAKGGLVEGGMFEGKSHADGGVKFASGGRVMEAEGGEAIINKRSTAMFKPMLSAMNQMGGGKKFALGGITPEAQLMSGALSEAGIGAEMARQLNKIKVINVVSETTAQQNSITNVESEAIF